MTKFNTSRVRAAMRRPAKGPVVTDPTPSGRTFEGAPGYARSTKAELFLLAVTNMVSEDTFYEAGTARDDRFERLVRAATAEDPRWTAELLRWLRTGANMRSASLVGAAEFVKARLDAGEAGMSRQVVDSVLQRADEPGELLAYWMSRHGRTVPKPVKRGVADAVGRLYTERNLLKYDTASHGFRFGDVLDVVHAAPHPDKAAWQGDLFRYALDRRHDRGGEAPASLWMVARRAELAAVPAGERRAWLDAAVARGDAVEWLDRAGMTWESLAGWLGGPLDAAAWEAMMPSMGFMSLLRNLRNFDEAGVSDEVASTVAARLADKEQVKASRQLPMRFLSAYRAAPSLRWSYALEKALYHALSNVPRLKGRTLVLVDTSGSMHAGFSKDGTLMRWDAAVLFGVALAQRCASADVVSFSTGTKVFPLVKGESLLTSLERWRDGGWFFGNGTNTAQAVRAHYRSHDRVVILTDEQAHYSGSHDVTASVPREVPVYTWNLAGYKFGHAAGAPNRHTFGGLTDASFSLIPLMEGG
ncbi:MAG TPA: TROVE domain-containing protein, partial [Micromonosporaceae bacterium]|nr:TROVE domain-containing protein [Micromonosporaceae bacterium]